MAKKWTPELIESELRKCIESLMLDRMPTAAELREQLGRNDLHVQVGRTKKYSGWAAHLGLSLKSCETHMGNSYENKVGSLLVSKGYEVESMTTKHPYDLLVNGTVKIDVKVAKPNYHFKVRCHTFGVNKKEQTCDVYICVAINEQSETEKIFVIPSHMAQVKTLNVCNESKYNRFIDAWHYIEQYSNFMASVQ